MRRLAHWRHWQLIGYLLLWGVMVLALRLVQANYDRDQAREVERRRDRYEVCMRSAEERQSLYDLLTLRPIPKGTPDEIKAKVKHAQQVFARPADCQELL